MTLKNLFKVLGLDKVDWKKATTRLLAVLWGVLVCCFIIKIFGGNIFEIITYNKSFIKICNYLEETNLFYLVYYPFYLLSCYLPLLIISRDKPRKWNLWYLIPITLIYIIKTFNDGLAYVLELLMYVVLSLKVSKRPWRALELFIVTLIFQFISLITKNIGYTLNYDNVVISLIYMIDYYIMMFIYCINTIIRKEGIIMGLLGPWLLSKKARQLTAYREKLVTKRVKLDGRIKELDRAIENEKVK